MRRFVTLFTLLITLVPSAAAAQTLTPGNAAPDLIIGTGPVATASQGTFPSDRTVVRRRSAQIQTGLLAPSAGPTTGRRMGLGFFDDVYHVAVVDLARPVGSAGVVWSGRLEGVPESMVTIALRDGAVAADVRIRDTIYQIRSTGPGRHESREVDPRLFPDEAPPLRPAEGSRADSGGGASIAVDSGALIDVMVVYTAAAAAAAGGTAGMNSQIDLMVAVTNTAYANSGINPRLRLVHSEQVTYTETGNGSLDLNRLTNPSDGHMDNVHTLRNAYAADVVALIEATLDPNVCGIAWLNYPTTSGDASTAFAVVRLSCAASNFSFAHELGHNMGAEHDRAQVGGGSQAASNYGYVSPTNQWRTIMAYAASCGGCPRVQYFSNPSNTYLGEAMGIPSGQTNAADNRLQLNSAASIVANFRDSAAVQTPTRTATPTATATLIPGAPTLTPTRTATPTATTGPSGDNAAARSGPFTFSVPQGQSVNYQISFENTGSTTWRTSDGYALRLVEGNNLTFSLGSCDPRGPGTICTWSLTSSTTGVTPGVYTLSFRMDHAGTMFGDTITVEITVTAPTSPTPTRTHTRTPTRSATPTLTPSPVITSTPTTQPTLSPTVPALTPVPTGTATATQTASPTFTATMVPTQTPTPPATATQQPAVTVSSTPSPSPSATSVPTTVPTLTRTLSPTVTATATVVTATFTGTPTRTAMSTASTPTGCALASQGDANCDGRFTLSDYTVWRNQFLGSDPGRSGDFNGDGRVTLADYTIWRNSFLSPP